MSTLSSVPVVERSGPPEGLTDPNEASEFKSEEANNSKDRALEERLTQVEANANSSQDVAKLIAIPEVREVLTAMQNGKDVKVLTGEEVKEGLGPYPAESSLEPLPSQEEFDEMSNSQLYDQVVKTVGTTLASNLKGIISEQLKPLQESISRAEGFIGQAEQENVQRQAVDLAKKYKDFGAYRDKMMELNSRHSGMNLEQLYHLAKLDAGSPVTPMTEMSTERPSTSTGRAPKPSANRAPIGPGRRALRNKIDEVLEGQDWGRFS